MKRRGNRFIDRKGQTYGSLTVLKEDPDRRGHGCVRWLCSCKECGSISSVRGSELQNRERCTQCSRKLQGSKNAKHGMYQTSTYSSWAAMISRCSDKNNQQYPKYGGVGITVCDSWRDFENFLADMGEKPFPSYSIDRIDNSLGYCKENCRWLSKKGQARNRRNNVTYTYKGETKTQSHWAEEFGISRQTLRARLKRGLTLHEALTTPLRGASKNGEEKELQKEGKSRRA